MDYGFIFECYSTLQCSYRKCIIHVPPVETSNSDIKYEAWLFVIHETQGPFEGSINPA